MGALWYMLLCMLSYMLLRPSVLCPSHLPSSAFTSLTCPSTAQCFVAGGGGDGAHGCCLRPLLPCLGSLPLPRPRGSLTPPLPCPLPLPRGLRSPAQVPGSCGSQAAALQQAGGSRGVSHGVSHGMSYGGTVVQRGGLLGLARERGLQGGRETICSSAAAVACPASAWHSFHHCA